MTNHDYKQKTQVLDHLIETGNIFCILAVAGIALIFVLTELLQVTIDELVSQLTFDQLI